MGTDTATDSVPGEAVQAHDVRVPPYAVKYVITSPLSLARVLWWYGEDELWGAALALAPATVADLAPRFAQLRAAPEIMDLLWPGGPVADAHLVLGVMEQLDGHPRPAARRTRRGSAMPEVLDLSDLERWHDPDLAEVLRLVLERTGLSDGPEPWRLGALYGRYAPAWRMLPTRD